MITYKQFKVITERINNMSIIIGQLAANANYLNQQIQLLQATQDVDNDSKDDNNNNNKDKP